MVLDKNETRVKEFLESNGFNVTKISESDEEMPDFLVHDDYQDYVIEVKSRETDKSFMSLLESRTPGEKTLSLGYRNRLSGIIHKVVNQIDSFSVGNHKFKLLWFVLETVTLEKIMLREGEKSLLWLEDMNGRQLVSTLYGLVEVGGYNENGDYFDSGCFYYLNSEFFRYKQLSAVVIQTTEGLLLCVNDLSKKYVEFLDSFLFKLFAKTCQFVIDPKRMEEEGRCLVVYDSVDRKNEDKVYRHVIQKYNLMDLRVNNFVLVNMPLD